MVVRAFGFLLIDKPHGAVSFDVVRRLRKILKVRRMGYAGTLDPLASGLMLVAVGEATKILNALEGMDKVYDVKIRFGAVSETYDAEGPIEEFPNARAPSSADLGKVLQSDFNGEQKQIPPRYSAVKIDGKRAYDLVRKGHEVTMPTKKIIFHNVSVRSFEYPVLDCTVHCGSGTYIRSFAHDLGQKLDCGGYVEELRRTKIGKHSIEDAVPLDKLTSQNSQDFLQSPQEFLSDWQQCELSHEEDVFLGRGGFLKNRWNLKLNLALAMNEGMNVGLLEPCEGGASVKFAKKFVFD